MLNIRVPAQRKRPRAYIVIDCTSNDESNAPPAAPADKHPRPAPDRGEHGNAWQSFVHVILQGRETHGKFLLAPKDIATLAITSRSLNQDFKGLHLDLHDVNMTGQELEKASQYYNVDRATLATNFPRNKWSLYDPESDTAATIDHFRTITSEIGEKTQAMLLKLTVNPRFYITHLGTITKCLNLNFLDIDACVFLKTISGLGSCTQLQTLRASKLDRVKRLGFIAKLKDLVHLELDGHVTTQYGTMWELPSLEHLSMKHHTQLQNPSFLSGCPALTSLELDFCPKLNPEQFGKLLPKLPNLTLLNLTACILIDNAVVKVIGMHNTQLRCLQVGRCPALTDVAPLANCKKLRFINIRRTGVTTIWPLINMEHLEQLDLYHCPIARAEVEHAGRLLEGTIMFSEYLERS